MLSKRLMPSILLLSLLILPGCREQILHDLSENDANRIITELSEISLGGEKVKQPDGKWSISVPTSEVSNSLAHLKRARLMREDSKAQETSPFITSREDQRFRYERNLSREIERSLTSISGVLEARVHLNLPPADPIFGQRTAGQKGSASLLLVTSGESAVTKDDIAALVGGAAGIEKEAVSVLVSNESTEYSKENIASPALTNNLPIRDLITGLSLGLLGVGSVLIYLTSRGKESVERGLLRNKLISNEERILREVSK